MTMEQEEFVDDSTFSVADFYGTSPSEPAIVDAAPEPDVDGQGEVTGDETDVEPSGETEGSEPPLERQYFDPEAYASQYAKLKVDGEEVEVPLSEVMQGYQRQADYTRKTQELAQQREQIAFWQQVDAAAKVNPQLTLEYLQQHYGVQPQVAAQDADDEWGYDQSDDDPYARQLNELRQQVAPAVEYAQQQQAAAYIDQVVSGLSTKYGEEFNATEVIAEAYNRKIFDPAQFESIYKEMSFDRYRAKADANSQTQNQRLQEEAAKKAAAAAQAAVVTSGVSASAMNKAAASPRTGQATSVWEAWEQSKAEHAAS